MSDWKKGFTEAVAKVVLEKGTPAEHSEDTREFYKNFRYDWTYGYYHDDYYEIRKHSKTCKFTASTAKAVEWSEFQDTDADNLQKHGLYVIASCECGEWENIWWVYEGALGDVLNKLLEA